MQCACLHGREDRREHTKLSPSHNGRLQVISECCRQQCNTGPWWARSQVKTFSFQDYRSWCISIVLRTSAANMHLCHSFSSECHCPVWNQPQQPKISAYGPVFAWELRDPHQWDTQTWARRKPQQETSPRSASVNVQVFFFPSLR